MSRKADALQPIDVIAEAIRDADQAAIRAMQEAAYQLDRSRQLAEHLDHLQQDKERA